MVMKFCVELRMTINIAEEKNLGKKKIPTWTHKYMVLIQIKIKMQGLPFRVYKTLKKTKKKKQHKL